MNDLKAIKTSLMNGPTNAPDPWLYTFCDADSIVTNKAIGLPREVAIKVANKEYSFLAQEYTYIEVDEATSTDISKDYSFRDDGARRYVNIPAGMYNLIQVDSHSKKYTLRNVSSDDTMELEVEGIHDNYSEWFRVCINANEVGVVIEKNAGSVGKVQPITIAARIGVRVYKPIVLQECNTSDWGVTDEFQ